MIGFFPASEAVSKPVLSLLPKCGACGLDKTCLSPKMPVSGAGQRGVLIVAEAPGSDEDNQGTQLVGQAGQQLRNATARVGWDLDRDCWKTNSLICRPPENRTPTSDEIDYCRPNLSKTIRELNPRMIVPLGAVAVRSLLGPLWRENVGSMAQWAGWRIPLQDGNRWVCPNYHPSYVLHCAEMPNGPVVKLWFERYIEQALQLEGRPYDVVPNYLDRVRVILDPHAAADWIRAKLIDGGAFSFDYETTTLKPDSKDAEIVCCGVCWNGQTAIAYPWLEPAITATGELIRSKYPKIGGNCFSGDTKLLTKEYGSVEFESVVGQWVHVLNRDGRWVPGLIKSFGVQKTVDTVFCRRNYLNTVRSTLGHRWILSDGTSKTTSHLQSHSRKYNADCIPYLRAPKIISNVDDYRRGVRHGIVLGDGNQSFAGKKGGMGFEVRLCGAKRELLPFFDGYYTAYYPSSGDDPNVKLPRQSLNLKKPPPVGVSDSYLIGFFRGLLATDGTVNNGGQVSITNTKEVVSWCKRVLGKVGYWFQNTTDLSKYAGKYKGSFNSSYDGQTIDMSRESVCEDDLLRSCHKIKYKKVTLGPYKFSGFGETRLEEVYCAVVPDGHSFVLDGGLLTSNCKFEDRWTRAKLGFEVNNFVADTVLDAHILDNRESITSVKFQAFVRLGVPPWNDAVEPFLSSMDGTANGKNRIREVEINTLLRYCAMDALMEFLIAKDQKNEYKTFAF